MKGAVVMTPKRFSTVLLSGLLLALSLLVACSLIALAGFQPVSAAVPRLASPSFVRVIHASPYVGTADVFVDGNKLLSSFAFGSVTNYAPIPPGPHRVQIALVGKGVGASVLKETLSVSPGLAYTVAAIGTQPTNLALEVFVDTNVLSPGTAKLRVYQLSPDAGPVTITTGGKTLVNGISYQHASGYLVVPARGYTFTVVSPINSATLSTSATLKANMVASLFVVGMFNGPPKSELITSQTIGLPGLPATGSDPNAAPQDHPAGGRAFLSWVWLLGAASLLCIACGIYGCRIIGRRNANKS
jgi:hypothetical protein